MHRSEKEQDRLDSTSRRRTGEGANSSSPCVVKGRLYYGTTAGNLHILDATDGKVVKSLRLGWPITGSLTFANNSIYFQTVAALVHCLDLDGNERWAMTTTSLIKIPKRTGDPRGSRAV